MWNNWDVVPNHSGRNISHTTCIRDCLPACLLSFPFRLGLRVLPAAGHNSGGRDGALTQCASQVPLTCMGRSMTQVSGRKLLGGSQKDAITHRRVRVGILRHLCRREVSTFYLIWVTNIPWHICSGYWKWTLGEQPEGCNHSADRLGDLGHACRTEVSSFYKLTWLTHEFSLALSPGYWKGWSGRCPNGCNHLAESEKKSPKIFVRLCRTEVHCFY